MRRLVALVVDAAPTAAGTPDEQTRSLAADLAGLVEDASDVVVVPDAAAALEVARQVDAEEGLIPVVFVDLDLDGSPDVDRVIELHDDPALRRSRFIIVTEGASLRGVDKALQAGAILQNERGPRAGEMVVDCAFAARVRAIHLSQSLCLRVRCVPVQRPLAAKLSTMQNGRRWRQ